MVVAVIPSRYQSSRFPGKALVPVAGVPLIARVVRRVRESGLADRVLCATDDQRIAEAAAPAGAETWVSGQAFRSGSDRVAAAVAGLSLAPGDRVINVQGDEPLVDRRVLDAALRALAGNDVGTVAAPAGIELTVDPDAVKVLVEGGLATRFARDGSFWRVGPLLVHIGVYAFTASSLRRFAELPSTDSERGLGLEQLRALDHGLRVGCNIVRAPVASVNRPEDVARVESLI